MIIAADSLRSLDPASCRRIHAARDRRFDGEFFVAVASTGIYCRPVCPARLPAAHNVRYFRLAAQAAEAGFRPCLRCRPETAPGSPGWLGSAVTVQRALRLIREGALEQSGGIPALAARLGIGPRYLLKLFRRELGITPSAVARHQRLLLARQLIVESTLPLTDVAFAAGFGSVRRFNSAVREAFGSAPGALRRRTSAHADAPVTLQLRYRPPYDWDGVLAFLARHAIPGIDAVDGGEYQRRLEGGGELRVTRQAATHSLQAQFSLPAPAPLQGLVGRLRRMFDLDADPQGVAAVLGTDPLLGPLVTQHPGLRCPGHFDIFEAALRAVIGQQISTDAARDIAGRLAAACGGSLSPDALLALPDRAFPMPARRRDTLRELCRRRIADGDAACRPGAMADVTGVGPWTQAMVALRGWGDPDAFPATDLGIARAWARLDSDGALTASRALSWSPYRGYAASLLWRIL